MQAVVVACLQERAPLGWLKRWKLSGPLKTVTRTVNRDHLSQAFRSFMALSQVPTQGSHADAAAHSCGQRSPASSKKASRSAKKQPGRSSTLSKHSTALGTSGHGDGIRRSAEELLARAGNFDK